MDNILWIVQTLLAAAFSIAGYMKVSQPIENLRENLGIWVEGFSHGQVKMIGIAEILGAAGLILPMYLNISPVLTPTAAIGLAIIMIGAITTHLKLNESKPALSNLILFILAAFVAVGRLLILPVI